LQKALEGSRRHWKILEDTGRF